MSQVLFIDESNKANNLVGYLNKHHVEKLLSSSLFHIEKGKEEEGEKGYTILSSPLLPLGVVIDKVQRSPWRSAWYCGRLYLPVENPNYPNFIPATSNPMIPNDAISLIRETITQFNAILAFDCTLSYKLRLFADGTS